MSLIRSFFAIILIIGIAAFAILNREDVSVTWSPIHDSYILPLYAVILGSLLFGFLLGACAVWINHAGVRTARRKQKKQIKNLEKELESCAQKPKSDEPPSDFFPALPNK